MRARDVIGPIALVGAAAALRLTVLAPDDEPERPDHSAEQADADDAAAVGGAGDLRFYSRDFEVGQCIWWDQIDQRITRARTRPCEEPHLFEVTGLLDHPDGEYPGIEGFEAFGLEACAPISAEYLGAPALDPHGRWFSSTIYPSARGWDQGDHQVVCGLQRFVRADAPAITPESSGPATRAELARTFDVGDCIGELPDETGAPVQGLLDCGHPHHTEIAGYVLLPDGPEAPSDEVLAEQGCDDVAAAYLGGPVPEGFFAGIFPPTPESWAAGSREFECGLRQVDGATTTGSLRSAP